ncbi:diacylglycerol kinase family lipid kinase [Mesorhizobium sp. SP-1A]|uniref:diacylglycerol/lipid kinase family protein n=1 Tax=Mesorhizobium sp. SP-1A TaxID=3077840 RepID=UPI0028F74A79|nr:diacylglycerol kinase family lipid kinase [Mesorhizobium sp. SP-1A]
MRFAVVLNRDGGTLRTTDLDALSRTLREVLERAGHELDIEIVHGRDIAKALDRAAAREGFDVVMAGGGDGTISAAAARLMDSPKALAVLPAGTMNLFARSLRIPQTLEHAIETFATGEIASADIVTANGQPFIHQFSTGMHARMVALREKMEFGSRLGKMRASVRAAWIALRNPRSMDVALTIDGVEIDARATGLGVTNNLFGGNYLPYADDPAGGVLGVYVMMAQRQTELLRLVLDAVRGKWHDSPHVETHQGKKVVLKIRGRRRRWKAVMDGELVRLENETIFEQHPGALKVLVPANT